jgi:hypothetical protein
LHDKEVQNPYTTVMSIICKTLAHMDDDQMIPAYGFGDSSSRDKGLFSFAPGDQPLHKLEGVLQVRPSRNFSPLDEKRKYRLLRNFLLRLCSFPKATPKTAKGTQRYRHKHSAPMDMK